MDLWVPTNVKLRYSKNPAQNSHKTSKKGYQQNIFAYIINFKHSHIFIPIKIPMNEKRIVKWMPKGTITIVLGIHPKNRNLTKEFKTILLIDEWGKKSS